MALSLSLLRRRQRIAPLRPDRDRRSRRNPDPITLDDDYLVEGEEVSDQPSTAARVVNTLQIVLIIVMAALALAIVWLLGVVFNLV